MRAVGQFLAGMASFYVVMAADLAGSLVQLLGDDDCTTFLASPTRSQNRSPR